MTTDFDALLSKNADDIERPVPVPQGSYVFTVLKHKFDNSTKKGTPYVEFECQATAPLDDVDEEELREYGDLGQKQPKLRNTFYLTEDALFRLTDFLEHLGLDTAGRTLAELIPESAAGEFIGNVGHRMSEDGSATYAELNATSPVE